MKTFALLLVLLWYSIQLAAQPTIEWQKTYGGNSYDQPYSIQQTGEGGFIIAGSTSSTNGDIINYLGGQDFWIINLNNNGTIIWKRVFGGTGNEVAQSITQTKDGGFVAGYSESDDHDVSGNHGGFSDGWVIKLNNGGEIQWQHALGGSGLDEIWSAKQTSDKGFILAGKSKSIDGDVTENYGESDVWVVKLDETGNIIWQRSFGGSKEDAAHAIIETSDGGYILNGETASSDGYVTGLHGNVDFWVVKLSVDGELEWQKSLGGTYWDVGSDVIQTKDGGYAVVGYMGSNDGDVTGFHGMFDYWIGKLSSSGELEWQKALGGSNLDYGEGIVGTKDGGYLLMGGTQSSNGDVQGNNGGAEYWVVKVDSIGQLVWQQTYGGNMPEDGYAICNTSDNGYALAGFAWSANNGDLLGSINQGKADFWIVKLAPETVAINEVQNNNTSPLEIYPNPTDQFITLQLPAAENEWNIRISNLQGQVVFQQTIQNGDQTDISTLANGLYIVEATAGGKMFRGKVVKN